MEAGHIERIVKLPQLYAVAAILLSTYIRMSLQFCVKLIKDEWRKDMKRYKKRDMLQSISMLKKANDAVVKTLHKAQRPDLEEALAQCQETAILLGTYLETQGEEGISLVHMLEDYCENIYQMSQSLQDESACRKISKKIQKQLVQVENGIKFQLPPDRREVVFLPYKASMWDSLESVYLAAKEDENCDAYCIPIPYYDRRPDGSLGMMHYEGNEYPKNIEITDYRTYDLEERHPDVIYIHNPYDGWNHVTCVPEQYFASTLRNYTDELIYIPYFVLDEIEPDDQARIEQMKHFCFTPGVIYAHKVIVQSEKMRQIYINEYIKAAKENGLSGEHTNRKYLEQKILGLGSPKFDKVLNTKKEDLDIPEEWLKIIEKPDGSWKKIVFYNTSVSALLQNDERMLCKIQDVFRVFKENRDEVALLWRPHPLIKTTIESMRPQLWEDYSKIVEQYQNEGWGIYDDSADMDRAVILSDAYYGDCSSVVQLYQKTQKPVMIQNANVDSNSVIKHQIFKSMDAVWQNQYVWVASVYTNVIFQLNIETCEVQKKICIPEKEEEYFSVSFLKVNKKIYFAPYNARELWVLDIKKNVLEKLDIGLSDLEKEKKAKFPLMVQHDQILYLFGQGIHGIIAYELYSGKIERYVDHIAILQAAGIDLNGRYFGPNYEIVENTIYCPLLDSNKILAFNFLEHSFELYEIPQCGMVGLGVIKYLGDNFILTNDSDEEIIWNPEKGVIKKENLHFLELEPKYYGQLVIYNNGKLFFGGVEDKIGLKYAEKEGVERVPVSYPMIQKYPNGVWTKFEFVKQNDCEIIFQIRSSGEIYIYNINTKKLNLLSFLLSENECDELFSNHFKVEKGKKYMENSIFSIKIYIDKLMRE